MGVGVILVLGLSTWLFWRRKRRQPHEMDGSMLGGSEERKDFRTELSGTTAMDNGKTWEKPQGRAELEAKGVRRELPG